MPRDIPIGNGRLLITFDAHYQLRDLFFPHVGQENHAGGSPCRFGVHADLPPAEPAHDFPQRHKTAWTPDGWHIRQRYLKDTLTTSVALDHDALQLSLYCNDAVDFHRNIHVRKIKIRNRAAHTRDVRLLHHQDFNIMGARVGDTAYYDPDLRSIVHYRAKRYLSATFFKPAPPPPAGSERSESPDPSSLHPSSFSPHIDQYATGNSGFNGAEGTWRDADDGHLQGNPIAQGAVDSTMACHLTLDPDGEQTVYMALIAAESREELLELHKWLQKTGPQQVLDRTTSYWRLWISGTNLNFGNLPPGVVELFKRSLLIVRTQIDNDGAIVAANDSDYLQYSRDTYSYVWPRDGALVADALDLAGFPDLARSFYTFCQRVIDPAGYFHHKYNPDGSPASSWHPHVRGGQKSLPIQEDETALVVWALWRHYYRYRDIEFIRPMWVDVVQKAADFMADYRHPTTGLPLPSYDLWEERHGVHAYTVATVYGALKAARNFAVAFGDRPRAAKYQRAAEEIKAAAEKYLWSEKLQRYVRRLIPTDTPKATPPQQPRRRHDDVPTAQSQIDDRNSQIPTSDLCPLTPPPPPYEQDEILDSALYALYKFDLFPPDDPRVVATMRAIEDELTVKTDVGGVARYHDDHYHRTSTDTDKVPGNPWFICTLWLADHHIARAKTPADLKRALPALEWAADHALPSGVLAEQVHPHTADPLSVSPLTWSHATVVSTVIKYLLKLEHLTACPHCHQGLFHMRRPGDVDVTGSAHFNWSDAHFTTACTTDTDDPAAATATTDSTTVPAPPTARSNTARTLTLTINQDDCIACEACVTNCPRNTLRMHHGKAAIDLAHADHCDADAHCVDLCPTRAVSLTPTETHEQSPPTGATAPALMLTRSPDA